MFEFVSYWLHGLMQDGVVGRYWIAFLHIISYARVGQILMAFVIPVVVGALSLCAANGGRIRTKGLWSMCGLFILPLPLFVMIVTSGVNVFLMRRGLEYTNTSWRGVAQESKREPICWRNQGSDPSAACPIDSYYFEKSGEVDVASTVDVALCESDVGSCELWVIAPVFAFG